MITRLLAAVGLVVSLLFIAGELGLIQFRLYAGNDFKSFCEASTK